MATKTLGSNATNTLTAIPFSNSISAADMATIQESILNDLVNGNPIMPGAFSNQGLLYVPNRGILQVLAGDYVAIDATGWPILVSANAIASSSTSWTHS